MTRPMFEKSPLREAFAALKRDLIHEGGAQISTMRNYRFAIVQYEPKREFELRAETQRLASELVASGWVVLTISLQQLMLDRVRAQPDDWAARVIRMERNMARTGPERGLNYLKEKLIPIVEGNGGIAADCVAQINAFVAAHPGAQDRTVVLIGRAGALYPFFRSSALLKHIDGKVGNLPVVLLYPGQRRGKTGLSFMGLLSPDNDYRPRIYP